MQIDSDHEPKESKEKKRLLRSKILQQMEFYFSDSNLAKDRFLKNEILNSKDGFIQISLFLRFNKIRSLTSELKQILKAIKYSDVFELNEDKTMIRRCSAFNEPSQKETDKRTIYVENLSSNISSEKITKLFSRFGEVSYVSLPKFKSSHHSKGFAFIEFKEKNNAKAAIEYFENLGEIIPVEGKFPKSNPKIDQLKKQINKLKEPVKNIEENETDKKSIQECKRKLTDSEENGDSKNKIRKKQTNAPSDELASFGVISKKKWLKLRDDFLNKQKQEIDELKTELTCLEEELRQKKAQMFQSKTLNVKTDDIVKGCIMKLTFKSVENSFEVMKLTRQQFKKKYIEEEFLDRVLYVDIQKNSNMIFIRCKSSEATLELIKEKKFLSEFNKSLLNGNDEIDYFEKIFSNRHKKNEKKEKKFKIKTVEQKNSSLEKPLEKTIESTFQQKENEKNEPYKAKHQIFDD